MTDRVILHPGRGWHFRIGPLLVAHHRPPSGAPFFDQGWSTLTDDENPAEPRTVDRFCGYGLRWPRCFIGLGGRLAQRVSSWQGRGRRRKIRRAFPDGAPVGGGSTPRSS